MLIKRKDSNEIEKIISGCHSDQGPVRRKNQDRVFCRSSDRKHRFFSCACVCDGVGSLADSEVSSQIMTDGIALWYDGMLDMVNTMDTADILEDLEATIQELNEIVWERRQNKEDIGCTMSLMMLLDSTYYIFHVGDSSIYCIRENLYRLTPEEVTVRVKDGVAKKYLANYIGKERELWLNKGSGDIEKGDIYMLGSDGFCEFTEYRDYDDNRRLMTNSRRMEKLCEELVDYSIARGSTDNVTCALLYAD